MSDCGLNPFCYIGDAASSAFDKAMNRMVEWAAEGMGKSIEWSMSWWVKVPTPGTSKGSWNPAEATWLKDHLFAYTCGMMVISFIVAGVRMALEQNRAAADRIIQSMIYYMVAVGLATGGIGAMVIASDGFSKWIVEQAIGSGDVGTTIAQLLNLKDPTGMVKQYTVLVVLALCIGGVLLGFIQWLMMQARTAVLVVLVGVLPLSGSFTAIETGKRWFQRLTSWTLAFILWKPTAAAIVAVAIKLMQGTPQSAATGPVRMVQALCLFGLTIVALPALIKVINPLAGAVAGGGAGAGLALAGAGAGMAASAIPTGASSTAAPASAGRAGGGSGGGGGGNSGPGSGPSGANSSSTPAAAGAVKAAGSTGGAAAPAGAAGAAGAAGGAATGGATLVVSAASQTAQKAGQMAKDSVGGDD